MGGTEQQCRLVVARRPGIFLCDNKESRHVIRHVLDILALYFQPVKLRRDTRSDSRRVRLFRRHLCRFRARCHTNRTSLLESSRQPIPALSENFRLGIYLFHFFYRAVSQQIVMNGHIKFRANHHVRFDKRVKRLNDRSARAILNRHNTNIAVPLAHFLEYAANIHHGLIVNALPEFQNSRAMTETSRRPKVRDPQRPLQRERPAHQLAPYRLYALIRQRPFIRRQHFFKHRLFAVGCVYWRIAQVLDLADFHNHLGPLVEQSYKLNIKLIYLFAQFIQRHFQQ